MAKFIPWYLMTLATKRGPFHIIPGLRQRLSNLNNNQQGKGRQNKHCEASSKGTGPKGGKACRNETSRYKQMKTIIIFFKKATCILNFIYSIQYLLMCWANVNADAMLG